MAPKSKTTVLDKVKALKEKDAKISVAKRVMKDQLRAAVADIVIKNLDIDTLQLTGDVKELKPLIEAYKEL